MKNRNRALALMDNINTCSVIFASSVNLDMDRIDNSLKQYTYAYDTTSMELKAGDIVVILDARSALKMVTVVAVHNNNEVDVNAEYDYKCIIDTVSIDTYNALECIITEAAKRVTKASREDEGLSTVGASGE